MAANPQLRLFKKGANAYGGTLMRKRKGRVGPRPLAVKYTMHVVLRSSHARGANSLRARKNRAIVAHYLAKFSRKYGVKIVRSANVGNHLHLQIKLANRYTYAPFIRALTGAIAWKVGRARGIGASGIGGLGEGHAGPSAGATSGGGADGIGASGGGARASSGAGAASSGGVAARASSGASATSGGGAGGSGGSGAGGAARKSASAAVASVAVGGEVASQAHGLQGPSFTHKQNKFWDYRPFTRIITSLKDSLGLKDYIAVNDLEGEGYPRIIAEIIVGTSPPVRA